MLQFCQSCQAHKTARHVFGSLAASGFLPTSVSSDVAAAPRRRVAEDPTLDVARCRSLAVSEVTLAIVAADCCTFFTLVMTKPTMMAMHTRMMPVNTNCVTISAINVFVLSAVQHAILRVCDAELPVGSEALARLLQGMHSPVSGNSMHSAHTCLLMIRRQSVRSLTMVSCLGTVSCWQSKHASGLGRRKPAVHE